MLLSSSMTRPDNTSKHLLEMLGDAEDVVAVADDLQQVLITNEVETREGDTLTSPGIRPELSGSC